MRASEGVLYSLALSPTFPLSRFQPVSQCASFSPWFPNGDALVAGPAVTCPARPPACFFNLVLAAPARRASSSAPRLLSVCAGLLLLRFRGCCCWWRNLDVRRSLPRRYSPNPRVPRIVLIRGWIERVKPPFFIFFISCKVGG